MKRPVGIPSSRVRRAVRELAIVLACVVSETARAEGNSDLEALLDESIVTTASKSAETDTAAPGTSTSITAEELRQYGIHSLDEAIDFLSLGVVTQNPLRDVGVGARGVLITGDRGNHLLLLVNGHAVNEPLFGAAQFGRGAGIPMELVDHIEVIVGPGSVLYGSNAMFGVINVVTKRAKDFAGVHVAAETEIAKSYRGMAGVGYELGRSTELTVAAEYYQQNGPVFTFGPQRYGTDGVSGLPWVFERNGPANSLWGGAATNSYYSKVPSALVRLASGDFEVNLHASTYKRSAPYAAPFSSYDGDFNDPDNYELDRSMWGDVKYGRFLSPVVRITGRAYADAFDYQRVFTTSTASHCIYGDTSPCLYHGLGISRWVGTEEQASFNWFENSTFVTLVGVDGRLLDVHSKLDVQNADTLAYRQSSSDVIDDSEWVLGGYLQQTWAPTSFLSFNGGLRIDARRSYDKPVPSPRIAANIGVWRGGTLKFVYAEAFRAASWNELASQSPSQLIATDLRPERVRSAEAAIEQLLGAQHLRFGVFRSTYEDLIELHTLTRAEYDALAAQGGAGSLLNTTYTQYRNVTSIDDYGWNASVEGPIVTHKLSYGLNGTAAIARETDPSFGAEHPLTVAPAVFGNARVAYDLGGGLPVFALAAHYLGRRPASAAFTGGFHPPPYAPPQVELRATISGPVPKLAGLTYRASADYAFADRTAYVVGRPARGPFDAPAELAPVDQFRATIGLQYDFNP